MSELPDLITAIYEKTKREIQTYPCHTNRASSLGHDCERQLVYWRTRWQEATQHDVNLELIFREGSNQEKVVLRDLSAAGTTVMEQQRTLDWPRYQITGHVDGVLVVDGKAVPLEIKSMSDHIWTSIFKRGPAVYEWQEVCEGFKAKPWLRGYEAQLQLYMIFKNAERGILVLKNKGTGALAQVNMSLDLDVCERMIQRAERINAHVAGGTLPDRIEWDEDVCARCPFLAICLPDRVGKDPLVFISDEKVSRWLEEREAMANANKVYDDLHSQCVAWAWARSEMTIAVDGTWLIEKSMSKSGRRSTKFSRLPEVKG